MSVWSLCWWFGTMALAVIGVVVWCLAGIVWAFPLLLAAFASCAADAGWGLWE